MLQFVILSFDAPGATTSDIVQQYVFAIRAMRHVDPTGSEVLSVSCDYLFSIPSSHILICGGSISSIAFPDSALAPARTAIQEYLRTRRDAIRCIVELLTGDADENESAGVLDELELDAGAAASKVQKPLFARVLP